MGLQLASVADVKRVLHRDANDTSIDDDLAGALEAAEIHIKLYMRQDFAAYNGTVNTYTIYDRPEDTKVPVPVVGAEIFQIRLYRTPSATAYIAKPLIDYEVQHDGLQPPANLNASANASGGAFVAGTYFYVATATNPSGETGPSNEVQVTVVNNGTVTIAGQAYGGEYTYRIYRVQVQGSETSNASCLAGIVQAASAPAVPGAGGGPQSWSFTDTGAATTAGTAPIYNQTVTIPARWVRLHPTVFDIPFEGATSMHFPDNWSRIEIDYIAPQQVPAPIRDATALTAASIYVRGPITTSAFTSESLGGYSYTQRPLRGQSTGANEVIPEVAKALLRTLKRRSSLTT